MKKTVQVVLALPITLLFPFGLLVFCFGYVHVSNETAAHYFVLGTIKMAAAAVGLMGLWWSILAFPAEGVSPSKWGVICLVVGLFVCASMIFYLFTSPNHHADEVVFVSWLIGGPLVVGIWNLIRLLSLKKI